MPLSLFNFIQLLTAPLSNSMQRLSSLSRRKLILAKFAHVHSWASVFLTHNQLFHFFWANFLLLIASTCGRIFWTRKLNYRSYPFNSRSYNTRLTGVPAFWWDCPAFLGTVSCELFATPLQLDSMQHHFSSVLS